MNIQQTRALNDGFRKRIKVNDISCSPGVKHLPIAVIEQATREIANYDNFTWDNDPQQRHDSGTLEVAGYRMLWRIDYYGVGSANCATDFADRPETKRILSLMLHRE